ncbi:hypothetical protein GCM10009844_23620 [Nocardioides koreensis]|uniref:Uncharacterized protein n=1 Tax=Nocardioides koreensis TaxID=433651 RepID=A0ABP5LGR7_9ACTN
MIDVGRAAQSEAQTRQVPERLAWGFGCEHLRRSAGTIHHEGQPRAGRRQASREIPGEIYGK